MDVDPAKAYAYLIRFLELWGVRRAAVNVSPEELSSKIAEIKPILMRLSVSILEANSEALNDAKEAFQRISSVRGIGATSASKILHLLRPRFFVMWDKEIAEKKYHVAMNADGYVEFLKKCQSELKALLAKYKELGIKDPESWLTRKYGKPLAKLLDEYNWLLTRPWLQRILALNCTQ